MLVNDFFQRYELQLTQGIKYHSVVFKSLKGHLGCSNIGAYVFDCSAWSHHVMKLPRVLAISPLKLMLCHRAAVKSLLVHYYNADSIFWSFGIFGFILGIFENRILDDKPALK